MIDVIIPCYNCSKDYLIRALSSVAMQTIRDEIKVTIVRDGGKDYYEIRDIFKPILDIQEVSYNDNRGPGYARRFGYLHTNGEYIVNLDSDDTFLTAFSLKILKDGMYTGAKPNDICNTPFLEELGNKFITLTNTNRVWLHGMMYRRSFLEKHNILMNESYSNEDVGFNLLCYLCDAKINYLDRPTYCWHYNNNSIVRKDIPSYRDNLSFTGYVENIIWAFNEAEKRNIRSEKVILEKIRMMLNLFISYQEASINSPEYNNKNLKLCKKYYNEIFKEIENDITKEQFLSVSNDYVKTDKDKYFNSLKRLYEFLQELQK